MTTIFSVLVVAALNQAPLQPRLLSGDAALYERLCREYPAANARHEQAERHVTFQAQFETDKFRAQMTGYVRGTKFGEADWCEVLQLDPDTAPADEASSKVLCVTRERGFRLEKPHSGAEYIIRYYGSDPGKLTGLRVGVNVPQAVCAARCLYDLPVIQLLQDPEVRIERLSSQVAEGEEQVSFDFETSNVATWYDRGHVVLSPQWDWAVRSYQVTHRGATDESGWTTDGEASYSRREGTNAVVPVTVEKRDHHRNDNGTRVEELSRIVVESVSFEPIPDSQFTLSAFGVPEISLKDAPDTPQGRHWLFWCLLIAALVSGGLYYASSRSRRAEK